MLRTHADAIEFLTRAGICVRREVGGLGDALVVSLGHPSTVSGVTVHPDVARLGPSSGEGWEVVRHVAGESHSRLFRELEAACHALVELARAFAPVERCSRCHGTARLSFGEHCRGTSLEHWIASSCSECGAKMEADGRGPLPDDLRAFELLRRGEWTVSVARPGDSEGWSALRRELGLDLARLAALERSLPGAIFRGTLAEAERLCAALEDEGVVARVGRVG